MIKTTIIAMALALGGTAALAEDQVKDSQGKLMSPGEAAKTPDAKGSNKVGGTMPNLQSEPTHQGSTTTTPRTDMNSNGASSGTGSK